jgi:hypothetical protein
LEQQSEIDANKDSKKSQASWARLPAVYTGEDIRKCLEAKKFKPIYKSKVQGQE